MASSTPAATLTAEAAGPSSYTPTAASPSPVLQLSYESRAAAEASAASANASPITDATSDAASPVPQGLSAEQVSTYERMLQAQGECGVKPFFLNKFELEAGKNWDRFYRKNLDRFYKDRHYLTNEFKELADAMETDRIARGEQPSAAVAAVGDDGEDDDGQSPPSASPPAAASNAVANAAVVAMRPISEPTARPRPGQRTLLECGCGVGNAMFPLLRLHPSLFIYGVDVSKNAIQCVQNHPDYAAVGEEAADLTAAAAAASSAETHAAASSTAATVAAPVESASNVGGRCAAWVVDLVHEDLPSMLRENHLDFATLIFVLSAIHPTKMPLVLAKLHRALKKDEGVLFLRDYCQYDLAQLRFAKSSKLGSSWYVRQDGTRSYFFTLEEIETLLRQAGFEIIDARVVCKLVVNRKEKTQMSRRFVQVRARASSSSPSSLTAAAASSAQQSPEAGAASSASASTSSAQPATPAAASVVTPSASSDANSSAGTGAAVDGSNNKSGGGNETSSITLMVVRSGGFAGMRRQWTRSAEKGSAEAAELQSLAGAVSWDAAAANASAAGNGLGRDRFTYTITNEEGAGGGGGSNKREVVLAEAAMTESWKKLIDAVCQQPSGGKAGGS